MQLSQINLILFTVSFNLVNLFLFFSGSFHVSKRKKEWNKWNIYRSFKIIRVSDCSTCRTYTQTHIHNTTVFRIYLICLFIWNIHYAIDVAPDRQFISNWFFSLFCCCFESTLLFWQLIYSFRSWLWFEYIERKLTKRIFSFRVQLAFVLFFVFGFDFVSLFLYLVSFKDFDF